MNISNKLNQFLNVNLQQVKTGDFLLNFHNFRFYFSKKERIAQKNVAAEKDVCALVSLIFPRPKENKTIIGREDFETRLKTYTTNKSEK